MVRTGMLGAVVLAFAFMAIARGEILVSNLGTNLTATAGSEHQPEEVRVDDRRPCVAQSFAVSADGPAFLLTNVVLAMNYSGTGVVKAVLTLWNSMPSPGNSATPGLPMPQRPLDYLATKTFRPGISFNAYQGFTPQQPVMIKVGESYWLVLTYEEESPGAFQWWSMDRHTYYSYKELGAGGLDWREQRNTPTDGYLPNYWLASSISTAAAVAIEGTASPHLSVTLRSDLGLEIQMHGPSGLKVTLELTETLQPADWHPLTTAVLENGSATVTEKADGLRRFYRLR